MRCDVEGTNEFIDWFVSLTSEERTSVTATIDYLEEHGVALPEAICKRIEKSRHYPDMLELRVTTTNRHRIRVFFAFDPRRTAILLIGGDKTGRWDEFYEEYIPIADLLYDEHLAEITSETKADPDTARQHSRTKRRK